MSGASWADYPKYLEPGETLEWRATGDFWYLKQGDNLKIQVFNQSCTGAQKGDRGVYDRPFDRLVVTNRSDYKQLVNIVIGFGEFDRKDVTGTIYAVTGLLDAEGNTYHDDRITEAVNLAITNAAPFSEAYNQAAFTDDYTTELAGFSGSVLQGVCQMDTGEFFAPDNSIAAEQGFIILDKKGRFERAVKHGYGVRVDGGFVNNDYLYWFHGGLKKSYKAPFEEGSHTPEEVDIWPTHDFPRALVCDYEQQKAFGIIRSVAGLDGKFGLIVTDLELNVINEYAEFSLGDSSSNPMSAYTKDGFLYVGRSGDGKFVKLDYNNFSIQETLNNPTNLSASSGDNISYASSDNLLLNGINKEVKAIYADNKDYQGYGFVTVGDCAPLQILNQDAISKLSANVTLTQVGERLVKVEGEVIKAILELYAAKVGGTVPTDYLDYIYAIKGAGLNVSSGNESFKRVGQADNFSLLSPASLSITFSKRLLA